jgi:hypothetical protein
MTMTDGVQPFAEALESTPLERLKQHARQRADEDTLAMLEKLPDTAGKARDVPRPTDPTARAFCAGVPVRENRRLPFDSTYLMRGASPVIITGEVAHLRWQIANHVQRVEARAWLRRHVAQVRAELGLPK